MIRFISQIVPILNELNVNVFTGSFYLAIYYAYTNDVIKLTFALVIKEM